MFVLQLRYLPRYWRSWDILPLWCVQSLIDMHSLIPDCAMQLQAMEPSLEPTPRCRVANGPGLMAVPSGMVRAFPVRAHPTGLRLVAETKVDHCSLYRAFLCSITDICKSLRFRHCSVKERYPEHFVPCTIP